MRQSISYLILKLIVIECAISFLALIICIPLTSIEMTLSIKSIFSPHVLLFIFLIFCKLFLTVFVILQWLNEYYEITPTTIVHRWGIIFRNEAKYDLANVGSLGIKQGIGGKFFNYGTISFYDRAIREYIYFYLVHNPLRYYQIIDSLLPSINRQKNIIREHMLEKQDEEL